MNGAAMDQLPNSAELAAWVGRTETREDRIDPTRVRALADTLDRSDLASDDGRTLPPLWHWSLFPPSAPTCSLSPDGHPPRGGLLPPVALPRRMWAAGRVAFHRPLFIGARVRRTSRIRQVQEKHGRGGDLVFVTVEHTLADDRGTSVIEEQDIVYREAAPTTAPPPAPSYETAAAEFTRSVDPSPTLLFRYSAVTFNSHRIHYDRDYATRRRSTVAAATLAHATGRCTT